MIDATIGVPALLQLQLFDGAVSKFPRAYIRNSTGALVFTVNINHVGLGLYEGFFTPLVEDYYTATFIVYSDAARTVEDTYYEYAIDIYKASDPSTGFPTVEEIVDGVWDEQMLDHSIAGTFGIHFQVIREFSEVTNYEITASGQSLFNIMNNVTNQGELTRVEVNQNEVKIDQIIPAVDLARDEVIAEVDQNQLLIEALAVQSSSQTTSIINQIDQNELKIDQAIAMIATIQNNTTTRFIVPEQLMKPESGNKTYQFHLRLYDEMGNPEAPDTAPLIRIRNLNTLVDVVLNAPMTQDGTKIGAYYYNYTISSGALLEHYLVEATVVEGGATRYVPAVTEITEYQADLTAIKNAINDVDNIVTQNQSLLTNPVFGLEALHDENGDLLVEITSVDSKVDHITAVVDALPTDIATVPDVQAVESAVYTRPSITDLYNALEYVRSQIMGPDNITNTDVYDKIDFSGLVQTNDPRLDYLDANISSRSTLTAAQVWSYATRTLTNLTIPISEFEKVWDVLTSQLTVPGSIGKYILNMLDVPVSTRATYAQMQSLLVGVAQETSVQQALTLIAQDIVNGQVCCANLTNLLTAVKAKTDKIPANPATEQNIDDAETNLTLLLSNIDLIIDAIKVSTDRIPLDPAHEGTVSGIPHNPVLVTDPRLANLDAPVSSRATPIDISNLATHADVNNSTNVLTTEINQNEAKIDTLQVSVNQRPTQPYFDNKFSPLSTSTQLTSAKNEILNALPDCDLTAKEIWEYSDRTLTEDFPDISNLATKDDIVHTYTSKFSTTYRTATEDQELIIWMEKDGIRLSSTNNCVVHVKTSTGSILWSASLSNPSGDGVYRFIHGLTLDVCGNYYIVISITADSAVRTTQQAFFTIG